MTRIGPSRHAALICLALVAGCGNPAASPPASVLPVLHVLLEDEATLKVEGEARLPDGARIAVYVWHEDAEDDPLSTDDSEAVTLVRSGRYSAELPVGDLPAGVLKVAATFSLSDDTQQPPEIVAIFGESGERLEGNDVRIDDYGQRYVTAFGSVVKVGGRQSG